jgi:pantetheine-phosphate adenylyltransferase
MGAKVAVYPGSFDPIHNGHLDIIQRCLPLFDEVVVAVLRNDEKRPLFPEAERVAMIESVLADFPGCRVETFSGLLVDFTRRIGARVVVRGLRAVSDFETEFQMALMNRRLDPRVETLFMMPREDYSYLSSRLLKEVAKLGGELTGLAPPMVLERLRARLAAARP